MPTAVSALDKIMGLAYNYATLYKRRPTMKLQFACADFSFPLLSHDQSLSLIALLGVTGVDIGLFRGRSHLRPEDALQNPQTSARELSGKLTDRGLQFADIFLQQGETFPMLAVNHPDNRERAKSRDVFLAALEFVAACGCPHITGLPGIVWEEDTGEDSLNRSVDELAWRTAQAQEAGIIFAVEPHLGSVAATPERAMRLVQNAPGLTLTLDYTHFIYQGFTEADTEPLVPHASHFHARGCARGRLQTPVKDNVVDYPRVCHLLSQAGYKGWIGLEYVWIDWEHCNEVDNLSETILLRDAILKGAASVA